MTATAHALVGGAIAASVQNPALGIVLSASSHPILDFIPHWDEGWGWRSKSKARLFAEAGADLFFGLFVSYYLFGQGISLWYFLACVLASLSWDLLEAPYLFLNWRFFPFTHIYKSQSIIQGKVKLPWGILTQVATVGVVIFLLRVYF